MTREQAEQRALELFVKYKDPDNRLNRENASNQLQRIAYLKCWEDMNEQHNQLREAAEKVVDYALYGGLGVNLHDAICELEKELNQKNK